ncbi:hypothetical protein Q4F19_18960 [Sphingomonas sp. BIUV-7]|uniref:STAS/SEC14 domain-containing protein n=1 Tax=Sphingomonas natans TaxID=3063330 RepID=A0ABT8YDS1_9SPHN|nr:hypothetical protein [Sphingomonas sp. BIUV-7]MDO6416471.1 hypothetical protein [Sphingomonas sp. BIUV-7]
MKAQGLEARMQGHIEYRNDGAAGIVRIKGSGLWSVAMIEEHFGELKAMLSALREQGKAVRVLVDMSGAAVQPPEVAAVIRTATQDIYEPGDRIAMIVGSTLAKMQMRRLVDNDVMKLFVSAQASENWLRAYEPVDRAERQASMGGRR